VRFAGAAGSLTLKKIFPSLADEDALLAPARRLALHILWKIHIQGHLSSIHMLFEAIQDCDASFAVKNCKRKDKNSVRLDKTLLTSNRH
jgi:hypothetical protein